MRGRRLPKRVPRVAAVAVPPRRGIVQPDALGRGQARALRGGRPLAFLRVSPEVAFLGYEFQRKRQNQKPNHSLRSVQRRSGGERFGEFREPFRKAHGFRLRDRASGQERRQGLGGRAERVGQRGQGSSRIRLQRGMPSQMRQDRAHQAQRLFRVLLRQFREQGIRVAVKLVPQPGLGNLPECPIGLVLVHDLGARIHIRLGRIRLDKALAKPVDGRADDFVETGERFREIAPLPFGNAAGQGSPQLGRDVTAGKRFRHAAHPGQELAGGKFGERNGSNALRRDAFRQHHRGPPRQNGRLARSRAGFHEKETIQRRARFPPRIPVRKRHRHRILHQGACHTAVAAPRRSAAASLFQLQ